MKRLPASHLYFAVTHFKQAERDHSTSPNTQKTIAEFILGETSIWALTALWRCDGEHTAAGLMHAWDSTAVLWLQAETSPSPSSPGLSCGGSSGHRNSLHAPASLSSDSQSKCLLGTRRSATLAASLIAPCFPPSPRSPRFAWETAGKDRKDREKSWR